MSTPGWICMALLIIGIAVSATPAYKNYRVWLWRKWGYFNVAVPILIMLVANIYACFQDGAVVIMTILIPLDVVAVVAAIFTYFQIRKTKK